MAAKYNIAAPAINKKPVHNLVRVGYYELEKTIGKGNFAVVKLATNTVTKSKVAIKIIDKTCLDDDNLAKTYREISILKLLRHSHITRLYEVMESQQMIYLVTEYASNGEIFDQLVQNGRMKEEEAARVFAQMISAVHYCHAKGVVHRDLKAENVLLDEDMNVKLADFGFSNTFAPSTLMKTWCGSPPYAAPEVFLGILYDGPRADIWSLGIVLYVIVCGALPFDGKTVNELRSLVVAGRFRIPFFMSQDCEHLIRHILVVEPEKRLSLKQILNHRWMTQYSTILEETNHPAMAVEPITLDSVVVNHMLKLQNLTFDVIAESVHNNTFNHIHAIYNLLIDKLKLKDKEERQRLQHLANMQPYTRSRKTSITTGIVDRSEIIKAEAVDRLSPLTSSTSSNFISIPGLNDPSNDFEKFVDMDIDSQTLRTTDNMTEQLEQPQQEPSTNIFSNTRRHTVGPGDVAHEQALANPAAPINFKIGHEDGPQLPVNLPTLRNQLLQNFTTKNQHLLKPPTAMEGSSFGRRASDGGANLHIYYPTINSNGQTVDYSNMNSRDCLRSTMDSQQQQHQQQQQSQITDFTISSDGTDESNDEIQRYLHGPGGSKRHTVCCTDDLPISHQMQNENSMEPPLAHSPAPSGGRTRRTGLLTVTERPPVISPELIREVEARMNRNYLPPALKMVNQLVSGPNSPPAAPPPTPAVPTAAAVRRICGRTCKLPTVQEVGRYSPVRRATEGGKPQNHGPLYEYQLLQRGITSKITPSSTLDNSISLPGSPIHHIKQLTDNHRIISGASGGVSSGLASSVADNSQQQDIDVPIDFMNQLLVGLERLVAEQRICVESAQQIVINRKVPLELAQHLGLLAHSGGGQNMDLMYSQNQQPQHLHHQQQHSHSQSVSPIPISNYNKYAGSSIISGSSSSSYANSTHISGSASPNLTTVTATGQYSLTNSQNLSSGYNNCFINPSNGISGCPSPIYSNFSGSSSPNTYYSTSGGGGGASPMHQITKGLSGLSAGGGSITRGTSAAIESATSSTSSSSSASSSSQQPLDLSMDIGGGGNNSDQIMTLPTSSAGWYVPAQFYDIKPLNLSPAQQVKIVPTPPASPNLCIIQEENASTQQHHPLHHPLTSYVTNTQMINEDANFPHSHPQIYLTDVQGSEITLVALSDASRDSDDSLDGQSSITLQGLVISEPACDMPSITRGVGRKSSLEIEHKQENMYERRGSDRSDKSLAFSDDSLSNDSNILSPGQEPSASSGFKSGDSHSDTCDHTESRLSPDSLSDSRMSDECYELPLPHECSNLDSMRILEIVKQTIDSKMPPKGFILNKIDHDTSMCAGVGTSSSGVTGGDMPLSLDISNLSLEYSGGLQIELQVCDGRSKNNSCGKGIKLRRISGDQFEYGKLCQQLISSLTV